MLIDEISRFCAREKKINLFISLKFVGFRLFAKHTLIYAKRIMFFFHTCKSYTKHSILSRVTICFENSPSILCGVIFELNGMRRTMHIFLEHNTSYIIHHLNWTVVVLISVHRFVTNEHAYLVSLTFAPNGSNETVIRLTAFKLSNRKFLPIADIKPPERLSDPVIGSDILFAQKLYSFKWKNVLPQIAIDQCVLVRETYTYTFPNGMAFQRHAYLLS